MDFSWKNGLMLERVWWDKLWLNLSLRSLINSLILRDVLCRAKSWIWLSLCVLSSSLPVILLECCSRLFQYVRAFPSHFITLAVTVNLPWLFPCAGHHQGRAEGEADAAVPSQVFHEEHPGLECWDLCWGGWNGHWQLHSGKGYGIIKQLCLIVAHDIFQMLLEVIPDVFFGTSGCWDVPCLGRVWEHPLPKMHVASLPFSLRHERSAALRNTPQGKTLYLQCLCHSKSSQMYSWAGHKGLSLPVTCKPFSLCTFTFRARCVP